MRHRVFWIAAALFSVAIIMFAYRVRMVEHPSDGEFQIGNDNDDVGSLFKLADLAWFVPYDVPYREKTSLAQQDAVRVAISKAIGLYDNGDVEGLRTLSLEMPNCVTSMYNSVLLDLERPLLDVYYDKFLMQRGCDGYNGQDFARFVEINIEMALFLGDIELRRSPESSMLILLDCNVYKQLTGYRDAFFKSGQNELCEVAGKYLQDWCEHVESENGFMRRYMRRFLSLQEIAVGKGCLTVSQAIDGTRHHARKMISCGYTPKWLDVDFPLPEGEKGSCEK